MTDPRSVPALLAELHAAGVSVSLDGDKLRIRAERGFPDGARVELTRRKDELRAWLKHFARDGGETAFSGVME